jgi:hypothetical protein
MFRRAIELRRTSMDARGSQLRGLQNRLRALETRADARNLDRCDVDLGPGTVRDPFYVSRI